MGHGGVLEATKIPSVNYALAYLLETIAFCAPNCYALITGYVCVGKKIRYKNIITLSLQAFFYSALTTIIFKAISPESVELKDYVQGLIPFAYGTYWYFTAYFVMFFFIPAFNFLLKRMQQNDLKKFLFWLIVICSALPTLFHYDFAGTAVGYNALWLSILYIIGGYVKKYGVKKIEDHATVLALSMVLLTWLSKIILDLLSITVLGSPHGSYLLLYTSPTIVLYSVCMLVLFSRMRLQRCVLRFVKFFAPVTFGVYLFSEEPLIREAFITDSFSFLANFNPGVMVIGIIGLALLIWIIGSMIDWVRKGISKILRVDKLSLRIEQMIPERFKFC